MDQVIVEIARQTPALLVLAFLIVQQAKERTKEREFASGERDFRKAMSDHCHQVQERAFDVMDKCTEMLGKSSAQIDRMTLVLEKIEERHRREAG